MNNLIKNKKVVAVISAIMLVIGILIIIIINNKNDNFRIEQFDLNSQSVKNESNTNENNTQGGVNNSQENSNNSSNQIYIHIIGEVNNPGVITIEKGKRIVDAIEKAGGATEKADLSKINLAFVLSDGVRVKIPSIYDKDDDVYVIQNSGNNTIIDGSSLNKGGGKVNINTATQTELETLTGIGPSLANRILEYRNKNGKFKKVDDLKNVKGIGQSKFEGIKDEVVVD